MTYILSIDMAKTYEGWALLIHFNDGETYRFFNFQARPKELTRKDTQRILRKILRMNK